MELSRRFPNSSEAEAFSAGLHEASDGNVHSITMEKAPTAFMFDWLVTWIDENKKPAELPEKHPPLTPQQYVGLNGTVCPVCRGSDRMGHEVEYDHGDKLVTRGVSCNNPDCGVSWVECYELSGYDNLET